MRKPTYCSDANYDAFNQSVTIKFYFRCRQNSYFSREEKRLTSSFCSKSKENAFFLKQKHALYENQKAVEVVFKKVVSRAQFLSLFSSFCANGKRTLIILNINVRVDMILQTMDKTVSFLRKIQVFCSGSRDNGRVPMTS